MGFKWKYHQMISRYIIGFILFMVSAMVLGQNTALSPRIANYDMDIELDVDQKKIYGQQKLMWTNISSDTITELQYHLYLNAFKNNQSTFLKERGLGFLSKALEEDCEWAWIDIQKLEDENGNDLSSQMHYIQPDDDNDKDETVLRVPLIDPVYPGQSIEVKMEWTTRIPKTQPRTGYNKDYFFMAQWFPKVGVYEPAGMRGAPAGRWNCHQYHSQGEYYSDFGVYNLNINVPENFIVGASGDLINTKKIGNRITWTFQAKDVIDYTWTASPHFVVKEKDWKGVKLKLLYYPVHENFVERYFTAIIYSLEYLEKHFEKYPYNTLTIVDPPYHGIFSTGMEYPTLITTGSVAFFPEGVRTTETLAVHEFVHQYFMQIVATNEQEEPWLDEGFTTYYEGRILDHYYGEFHSTVDFWGINFGNTEYNRGEFFAMDNPQIADNDRFSWEFENGGYGRISYNKTGVWLRTLEGMLGIETMDEIMKTYYLRWKFKHPCGQDFIDVVNEVVVKNHGNEFGENMDWFFEQVLYGTALCDYSVASIENKKIADVVGIYEDTDNCVMADQSDDEDAKIKSKIVIQRLGDMKLPIEIKVDFEDGSSIMEKWDGQERSKSFEYLGDLKVTCVEIDPTRKIYLDKNFLNNSKVVNAKKVGIKKYLTKYVLWLQNIMQSLSLFV